MGGQVEKALQNVSQGLVRRDPAKFAEVHQIEEIINDLQKVIDNNCLHILAKEGPVAKDLRLILSVIKINTDLERMGDQCVNIAYIGKDFLSRDAVMSFQDIDNMVSIVKTMVQGSLDSFVNMDAVAAKRILEMDDQVDDINKKIYQQCIDKVKSDPTVAENYLDLILVARNLERLGDHATNIAEGVIFAFTGKDIRHGSTQPAT